MQYNPTKYDTKKPSRAVVALDGDQGVVLWAVGQINDEIKDDGHDADALGLIDDLVPATGIWVWEGFFKEQRDPFGTYTLPEGNFRAPTDAEWKAISRNESPWQDGLWYQSHLVRMC